MRLEYFLIALLVGCSTSPEVKPVASKPHEPMRRVSASKDDLLYNYTLGVNYPNMFERVEADANAWCKRKYNMVAVQRTQSQCGVYMTGNTQDPVCTVAFKCQ